MITGIGASPRARTHPWNGPFRYGLGFIIATIAIYVAPADWQVLLAGVQIRARWRRGRNPGEEMIRLVALLFFISIAAQAECVVYSTACKAGADWYCYGKVHE